MLPPQRAASQGACRQTRGGFPTSGWRTADARPAPGLLGPARVAGRGAAHHLQRQQRALASRRADVDSELLDDPVGAQALDLLERHPDQLVGADRGRRLRDRAAVAVEAEILDPAVLHDDVHSELVAAERVVVVEVEVVLRQLAEVPRVLVVVEDEVPVERVHRYSSKTSRALPSASTSRSTSSREL